MTTLAWKGDAAAVAAVKTLTVGGTIEATDIFKMTLGSKTLSVVAGSTVAATVATAIKTAWNALSATGYPQFAELTAADGTGGNFTLTCDTAGVDFAVTLATTETGGGAADNQTFTQVVTTANAGPYDWSTPANWSAGTVPVNADEVTLENSSVDILYGLDQSAVALGVLTIEETFTGAIGLPRTNESGYVEYRDRYLQISADTVFLYAAGPRCHLDTGTEPVDLYVDSPAIRSETGVPPILWLGDDANNTVTVARGDVGIAIFSGEQATLATLNVGYVTNLSGDATVTCGPGVAVTTIVQSGGTLILERTSVPAVTIYDGTLYVEGDGEISSLTIEGGTVYWNSTGPVGSLVGKAGGKISFAQRQVAREVTACTAEPGFTIEDPAETVTWTAGVLLQWPFAE